MLKGRLWLEVRLIPNAVANGRAYYARYLRAIVHHHRFHGEKPDWWEWRRMLPQPSSGTTGGFDDEDASAAAAAAAGDVCGGAPARGGGVAEVGSSGGDCVVADPVGPVCVVLRPRVYGRHWRHIIDTSSTPHRHVIDTHEHTKEDRGGGRRTVVSKRTTPRVTSGYLFLLTALELTGRDRLLTPRHVPCVICLHSRRE